MPEIIGVRFRGNAKSYYFAPNGHTVSVGDCVLVETARGMEFGEIDIANKMIADELCNYPLKNMVRMATKRDKQQVEENIKKEAEALRICCTKVEKYKLDMRMIRAEYSFDRSKILFYFTSDDRVDFRELVKDLASVFRCRIELRQIGVRDEAKMLGGLGICGREFCCTAFLGDFQPVSIKMAKEQGLSLNPTKISGACGRLMCCLKYEQDAYLDLIDSTPKQGSVVQTPNGKGVVISVSLLTGFLKVKMNNAEDDTVLEVVHRDDLIGFQRKSHSCQCSKKSVKPTQARGSNPEATFNTSNSPSTEKKKEGNIRKKRNNSPKKD